MGVEIDLLKNYPKPNRDVKSRASSKSEKDRSLAREFGEAFFDGDRSHGYGGFNYNPRFWEPVIPTFIEHWNLKSGDSILDVGCAKGFMIFDFYDFNKLGGAMIFLFWVLTGIFFCPPFPMFCGCISSATFSKIFTGFCFFDF
jgi:hypothetical protein